MVRYDPSSNTAYASMVRSPFLMRTLLIFRSTLRLYDRQCTYRTLLTVSTKQLSVEAVAGSVLLFTSCNTSSLQAPSDLVTSDVELTAWALCKYAFEGMVGLRSRNDVAGILSLVHLYTHPIAHAVCRMGAGVVSGHTDLHGDNLLEEVQGSMVCERDILPPGVKL